MEATDTRVSSNFGKKGNSKCLHITPQRNYNLRKDISRLSHSHHNRSGLSSSCTKQTNTGRSESPIAKYVVLPLSEGYKTLGRHSMVSVNLNRNTKGCCYGSIRLKHKWWDNSRLYSHICVMPLFANELLKRQKFVEIPFNNTKPTLTL